MQQSQRLHCSCKSDFCCHRLCGLCVNNGLLVRSHVAGCTRGKGSVFCKIVCNVRTSSAILSKAKSEPDSKLVLLGVVRVGRLGS